MLSSLTLNAVRLVSPKTPGALRGKNEQKYEFPTEVEAGSTAGASELFLPAAELISLLISSISLC